MSGERLSDHGGGPPLLEMDLGDTMKGMTQRDDLRQYLCNASAQIYAIDHNSIVSDKTGTVTIGVERKRESDPRGGPDSIKEGKI